MITGALKGTNCNTLMAYCNRLSFTVIRPALQLLLILPKATSTVEKSFNTVRRVNTWLLSTMNNDRLACLACFTHTENKLTQGVKSTVFDKFGKGRRCLQFIYSDSLAKYSTTDTDCPPHLTLLDPSAAFHAQY